MVEANEVQPKQKPTDFVLRGRPRPVVRFRRSVIIGASASLCVAIVCLTWMALEPRSRHFTSESESPKPFDEVQPEAITSAPATYKDVPKLGPPLPGDLGRPMLERRDQLSPIDNHIGVPGRVLAADAGQAERQRHESDEEAARASPLTLQLSRAAPDHSSNKGEGCAAPAGGSAHTVDAPDDPPCDKLQFATSSMSKSGEPMFVAPAGKWILQAGTVIPATLLTGINSDLPGIVVAQVSENVRDSRTGGAVLIPQGARLIGKYDSKLAYGQKRVLLVWQRLLFPNGQSLDLGDMPAADAGGYSGLRDRIDGHSWQLIKGILLSSVLGVGSQLSLGGGGGIVRALRESLQQNGSQVGEQIVARGLNVQPTVKIRPGWPVRVLVSKDLALPPWTE